MALVLLAVAIGVTVAWFQVSEGCRGEGNDVFGYFVVAVTAALTAATYLVASARSASRMVPIVCALIVASVGGFGVFVVLGLGAVSRCLD